MSGLLLFSLIVFVVWFLVVLALEETGEPEALVGGLFVTAIAIALHDWFSPYDVHTAAIENWKWLALGFACYLPIGGAWSIFRWYRYNVAKLKEWNTLPDTDWRKQKKDSNPRPGVSAHKSRIIGWIVYWPWSVFWYALKDVLMRVFEHVFELLKSTYQKVQYIVWKDVQ